jgi:hypothetical protein
VGSQAPEGTGSPANQTNCLPSPQRTGLLLQGPLASLPSRAASHAALLPCVDRGLGIRGVKEEN